MSANAWLRRRSKQGLGARQYAAVLRKLRRMKGQPLPITASSRGSQLTVTVTLSERTYDELEDWDDDNWDTDEERDAAVRTAACIDVTCDQLSHAEGHPHTLEP